METDRKACIKVKELLVASVQPVLIMLLLLLFCDGLCIFFCLLAETDLQL